MPIPQMNPTGLVQQAPGCYRTPGATQEGGAGNRGESQTAGGVVSHGGPAALSSTGHQGWGHPLRSEGTDPSHWAMAIHLFEDPE